MRNGMLALRMELLAAGEQLGWPRLPLGPGRTLRAGQGNWERLAAGPIQHVQPALRNAKIRRDNLSGEKEDPLKRIVTFDDYVKFELPHEPEPEPVPEPASKYTAEMRRANLAKAREAKRARRATQEVVA